LNEVHNESLGITPDIWLKEIDELADRIQRNLGRLNLYSHHFPLIDSKSLTALLKADLSAALRYHHCQSSVALS
jgi:hypothetical protein